MGWAYSDVCRDLYLSIDVVLSSDELITLLLAFMCTGYIK